MHQLPIQINKNGTYKLASFMKYAVSFSRKHV